MQQPTGMIRIIHEGRDAGFAPKPALSVDDFVLIDDRWAAIVDIDVIAGETVVKTTFSRALYRKAIGAA